MQYKKYFILSILFFLSAHVFALKDSTGLKIFSNNKVFIVHKVEKGQGLYAIAKRYNVEVKDIELYNPDVKLSGVKVDQFIFIPTNLTPEKAQKLIDEANKKKEEKESGTADPKRKDDNVVFYTVKAGETLYSVSKLAQCEFTIEELKKWNNLTTNSVKEGQKLIIAFREEVKIANDPVSKKTIDDVIEGEPKNGNKNTASTDTATVVWSDVSNTGLATWIAETEDNAGKSYALYSKAKIGTIIRVENLANNKATYVRVIGPLAGDEKKDVIMVITESAAKKLEVTDTTFRIELTYSNDQL